MGVILQLKQLAFENNSKLQFMGAKKFYYEVT